MNRPQGKTAIVTGGAVGIGGARVERMAADGATVAIFDVMRGEGQALASDHPAQDREVAFWRVDVTDKAAMKAAIADGHTAR